jgi:hypothetical protein
VRVWRLCKIKHIAFDGEGARRAGGRWNRRGTPVVYTSQSLSLAALELLVHCEIALAPEDLVAVPAEVPDAIAREELSAADLPRDWRVHPAPEGLARLGTDWIRRGKTAYGLARCAVGGRAGGAELPPESGAPGLRANPSRPAGALLLRPAAFAPMRAGDQRSR